MSKCAGIQVGLKDKEHARSLSAILTGSISIKRMLDTACEHAKRRYSKPRHKTAATEWTESSKAILQLEVLDTLPTYLPTNLPTLPTYVPTIARYRLAISLFTQLQ